MTTETPLQSPENKPDEPQQFDLAKLLIEFGPIAAFYATWYFTKDPDNPNDPTMFFVPTAVLMVGMVISMGISLKVHGKLPLMLLVTSVVVLVSGGLTLYLADDTFIKMKPTIVNSIFAVVLTIGLVLKKLFLRSLLDKAFPLTEEGWWVMTKRWIVIFVLLAIINEIVWRNFSGAFWANWKVFGNMGLMVVFSFTLLPVLEKYAPQTAPEGPES